MTAVESWIKWWARVSEGTVHRCDVPYLDGRTRLLRRPLWVTSLNDPGSADSLHRPLGAVPYVGNLKKSRIFLLMFNPGVSQADYDDVEGEQREQTQRTFRENRLQTTTSCFALQEGGPTGWGPYFRGNRLLGPVIGASCCEDRRECLGNSLAILELVPYFSKTSSRIKNLGFASELPSAQVARLALKEIASDKRNLIIPRWPEGLVDWNLDRVSAKARVEDPSPRWGLTEQARAAIQDKLDEIAPEHSSDCPQAALRAIGSTA